MLESLSRPCRAVVVGASGGIGRALVNCVAAADIKVQALSRRPIDGDDHIIPGPIDLADPASIASACATVAEGTPLRLVIVATGLLHEGSLRPEKSLKALDADDLARAFAINTIGPALLAKHLLPTLPREGKAVFAVLSARVGSISDNRAGGWYGYRASKAALNQIVRTLAIELRRIKPDAICVALHPGTVATPLSAPFRGGVEPGRLFTPDQSAEKLLRVIDSLEPGDSGGFRAWDGATIPF